MEILRPFDYTELMDHFIPIHKKFYSGEFDIPSSKGILESRVLMNGKGASAVGLIKQFAEIILVMDLEALKAQRVKNIDSLIRELILIAKNQGMEQIHSFPDEKFGSYLKKHYNFESIVGEPLVLNVASQGEV